MPDACVLCVIKCSTRSRDLNTASTDRSASQTKHLLPDCPRSVRKQSCCLIKCPVSFPQTQTVHRFSSINSLCSLCLTTFTPTFRSCSGALSSTSPTFQGDRPSHSVTNTIANPKSPDITTCWQFSLEFATKGVQGESKLV